MKFDLWNNALFESEVKNKKFKINSIANKIKKEVNPTTEKIQF